MAGQPQLMAERCSTCVFRPGNLMSMEPGALASIIDVNLRAGTTLVCHTTLSYSKHPELGEAVCRGFYDAYRHQCTALIIADLIGIEFALVYDPDNPSEPTQEQQ